MKQVFTLSFLLFFSFCTHAQNSPSQKKYSSSLSNSNARAKAINFNGQWKGGFDETSYGFSGLGGNDIVYVLELNTNGDRVSGYSYTYFQEGNKKYYTICRLTGSLNRDTKEIVVTEIERTKFNTPPNFQNCFQTHRLHYERDSGDMEVLKGTWVPAPNQGAGCGNGTTYLSRRVVNRLPLGIKTPEKNMTAKAPNRKTEARKPPVVTPQRANPPLAKKNETPAQPHHEETVIAKDNTKDVPFEKPEIKSNSRVTTPAKGFENRRKDILKTIVIEEPTFRLDFYDNGEIDGDSITVFYNGKVVLSHQKLTDKPISLTLSLDKNASENLITMYADNLGTIAPNTALMIVTDGTKRYEVRIESDLAKSGSVIFKSN